MASAKYGRSSSTAPPETIMGMAISLMFWLSLLVAAILFAVVSLAPKLEVYLQLRDQFEVNQHKLVAMEREAEQLQQVIDAIKTDTDFAAELIRIEFDAVGPGEEVIPVDSPLKLDARESKTQVSSEPSPLDPIKPFVSRLASDAELRIMLLGTATLMVILSFTILQPPRADAAAIRQHQQGSFWKSLRGRYARQT